MWIRQLLLAVFGFGAGVGLAGGFFALLIALGIISRFAHQTKTGKSLWLYETVVAERGNANGKEKTGRRWTGAQAQ